MVDSRARRLAETAETVGGAQGALPRRVRRALAGGERIPGDLGDLAELVVAGGTGVTDGHIQRLLLCGYSEDMVFECVVAAAVGAGAGRLRAVQRLLGSPPQDCPP
ncbi:MAG TPA: hypothetical protein VHH34_20975 [Pseudonocardiaceae bacterium]|nr:hypothetical protein [Pseudonocardiaceae bacterium]